MKPVGLNAVKAHKGPHHTFWAQFLKVVSMFWSLISVFMPVMKVPLQGGIKSIELN